MVVRLGEQVEQGQPLARLFASEEVANVGREKLLSAIQLSDNQPTVGPLILDRIT
jgi:thymidine phosphorylase